MKRALVAALAASLTTAAVLSASGIGATTSRTAKSRNHHAYRAGASGATGARPTGPPPTMAKVYADMQARREAQDKKLADALGVSVDKLHSAFDAVEAKRLADDVAANRLTQAEADAIKACKKAPLTCDHSNLPAFGGHGGAGGPRFKRGPGGQRGRRGDRAADLSALAAELGVTTDKLKSALQANRPQGGPGFGGPGGHMPDGDGPHGGGMPGPPMGGMGGGGPQGGSYDGAPASAGTDA